MSKLLLLIIGSIFTLSELSFAQSINCNKEYDYTWSDRRFYFDNINFPSSDEIIEYLDNIHIPGGIDYEPLFYNFTDSNVTEYSKHRLIGILKNEWTYRELKWKYKSIKPLNDTAFNNRVLRAAFALRKTYRFSGNCRDLDLHEIVYDSLAKPFKKKMEEEVNNTPVKKVILLAVGWLNLKEAIPILKQALQDSSKRFDRKTTQLVLAKFGDKEAKEKVFEFEPYTSINTWAWVRQRNEFAAFYIGTQESISMLHKLLDISKRMPMNPDDLGNNGYAGADVIADLLTFIKNNSFHEIFKGVYYRSGYIEQSKLSPEMITKAKQWLINNVGKYDLDYGRIMTYLGSGIQ